MGFFKSLFGNATATVSAISGEAKAAISQLQRKDDVHALLAIVALVAGADGEVEESERKAIVDYVTMGDVFKGFTREQLASTLDTNFKKCVSAMLKEDLYDAIAGIADEPDTAKVVMRAGIAVASADGEFEPQEREVLLEVCSRLGLNASDFRQLKS